MTAADFRAARVRLGMTQTELARALGVTDRAVRRYEAGDRAISEPVARLVLTLRPRRHASARAADPASLKP